MHMGYNDTSFHTKSIVTSRITLSQKDANGFTLNFIPRKYLRVPSELRARAIISTSFSPVDQLQGGEID